MYSQIIEDIKQAQIDLAIANVKAKRKARTDSLYECGGFIKDANLHECKWIINELIDRVSSLVGCATELEDAACVIQKEIDNDHF